MRLKFNKCLSKLGHYCVGLTKSANLMVQLHIIKKETIRPDKDVFDEVATGSIS